MSIMVTLATTTGQLWDCQVFILYEAESSIKIVDTYQIPGNYRTENRIRRMGNYLTVFNKLEYGSSETGNAYTVFYKPSSSSNGDSPIKPIG